MASEPKLEKSDGRGEIYSWKLGGKEFVISVTRQGRHRAGHAHNDLAPHYLLSGKVKLDTEYNGQRDSRTLEAREIYVSKPNEFHLLTALEDSVVVEEGGHQGGPNHPEWRKIVEEDAKK